MWQEVGDKSEWNGLVSSQAGARFLQSWDWGEFQQSLGRKVVRLSWNDEVLVQAVRMPLPFSKHYWYIPHGPLAVKKGSSEWPESLCEKLNDGTLFVRIDPVIEIPPQSHPRNSSLRSEVPGGPDHPPLNTGGEIQSTQPQCTRILDLSQSEDVLLSQMHQKTRYNIRLAEKRGVKVSKGSIEDFLRLNRETKGRDQFASHPDGYYRAMVGSLPSNFINIWQASYQNKIIASNIVITYGDTATYTHGASSNNNRDVMAPYLLHWRTIQDAKRQGVKHYDLWGANPQDPNHGAYKKSWEGISRFKAGFGGEFVCYPRSFDVIFNPWLYTMYTFARKFR